MIIKTIFITICIPCIISILFSLALYEKDESNMVHNSKLLNLYIPCGGCLLLSVGATLNFKSFVDGQYTSKDELIFSIILFLGSIMCLIILFIYKRTIIRYDDEKLLYRRKWYRYDEISTLGNDKNDYVFVLKNGKKIRFSILASGSNELCKAYLNYKKQK